MLPVEDEAFPYLSYLHPYGNTIFSRTQMKHFLAEWRREDDAGKKEKLRRLLALTVSGIAFGMKSTG